MMITSCHLCRNIFHKHEISIIIILLLNNISNLYVYHMFLGINQYLTVML